MPVGQRDLSGIAALLSLAAAAGAGLLYLMGWGYAIGYYGKFGLGLVGIDIPKEFFLAWGVLVLTEGWGFGLALLLAPAALASWRGWAPAKTAAFWTAGMVLLLIFSNVLAQRHGRRVAEHQWAEGLPGLPNLQVTLSPDEVPLEEAAWAKRLNEGCLRLLIQDKTRLWLVRPVKGAEAGWPAVESLPLDKALRFRILPGPTYSCP